MDCANVRDDMLDVLYEEATPQARRRFEEHQATCAVCRDELVALRALRGQLASWKLPTAGAGEAGKRSGVRPLAPRVFRGLAWAAGLLLALGAAIRLSGASFEFQHGPIVLQLGGPGSAAVQAALEARLAEQEARHRREIEALRARLVGQDAPVGLEPVLQSVRELIRDSEARQADALETRLAGFEERADARRRYDMARISAGLSYLDGKAGQQAARTTELVSYVLQASQPR
jgi:hypothetical protein